MWDRRAVMAVHQEYNHKSKTQALQLLRQFGTGNTPLAHLRRLPVEGCLVTSLAISCVSSIGGRSAGLRNA